jgi:hypothetical protein
MASVQMMCARVGMVTGRGLAGAFHHKLPKLLITVFATALLVPNTINNGADLTGMADAAQMPSGFNSHWFCGAVRSRDRDHNGFLSVSQHREHFEVARAYALCLCDHCVRGRSGLAPFLGII